MAKEHFEERLKIPKKLSKNCSLYGENKFGYSLECYRFEWLNDDVIVHRLQLFITGRT